MDGELNSKQEKNYFNVMNQFYPKKKNEIFKKK